MLNLIDNDLPPLGRLLGTIPMATILRTDDLIISIGSGDVFEGALAMQVVLSFPEGVDHPMISVPEEIRKHMFESHVRARISEHTDREDVSPAPEHPIEDDLPELPQQQPAHPEMRIRITDNAGNLMYGMPRGMGYDGTVAKGDFLFHGDIRLAESNPRILIEPVTWRSMFEPPEYEDMPEFEPKWSIPIDLDTLVPAKEIDAR